MGVRLCKISPTRGFAAELATALIITIAAQYGLPTSSSQCVTGEHSSLPSNSSHPVLDKIEARKRFSLSSLCGLCNVVRMEA